MGVIDDDELEGIERFLGNLQFTAMANFPTNVILDPAVATADIIDDDGKHY